MHASPRPRKFVSHSTTIKKTNTMKNLTAFYRVNQIRSQRAVEREGLNEKEIEAVVGDYPTLKQAMKAYDATATSMEMDKQLLFIDEANLITREIATTY